MIHNIVFAYIAHAKFQKASFNSNRDIRRNICGDRGDGNGPQNKTSPPFFKNGQEVISTVLRTRNLYSYSRLEIFICIYSVRGEIDQISTNTFRYRTCCAANVYMFVYILIGALQCVKLVKISSGPSGQ